MLVVVVLGIVVTFAACLAYLRARRPLFGRRGWGLAEVVVLWLTFYWIGAAGLLTLDRREGVIQFVGITTVTELAALLALFLGLGLLPRGVPPQRAVEPWEPQAAIGFGVLGTIVCLAFVGLVVTNERLAVILLSVLLGDQNLLNYRLTMYSGSAVYLAPGYVKQFRDVFLTIGIVGAALTIPRSLTMYRLVLASVSVLASVLSGERFVMMISVYTVGVALLLRSGGSAFSRGVVRFGVPLLVVATFIGATMILGRVAADASALAILSETIFGLLDRVVLAVPRENAEGFLLWREAAPTFGANWLADLAAVLPGTQSSLSNDLHEILGGSPLGNSPLGLAADTYLAWGLLGSVTVPLVFVLAVSFADSRLLRARSTFLRAARICFVPLSFAWYSPYLFLLNGGLVFAALAVLARPRDDVA